MALPYGYVTQAGMRLDDNLVTHLNKAENIAIPQEVIGAASSVAAMPKE